MAEYRYATLESLEAELGVDFSEASGAPADLVIYSATSPCMIVAASRKINDYTQTTFADYSSTPSVVTDVCHELTLRMITRAINWTIMRGLVGAGDDFGSINIESNESFKVELSKSEKIKLNQHRSPSLRVESD